MYVFISVAIVWVKTLHNKVFYKHKIIYIFKFYIIFSICNLLKKLLFFKYIKQCILLVVIIINQQNSHVTQQSIIAERMIYYGNEKILHFWKIQLLIINYFSLPKEHKESDKW